MMLKRFLSVLVCLCLLLSCCAASLAEAPAAHRLEKKTVPFYVENSGKIYDEVPLWLADGINDLPYMDLMTLPDVLNALFSVMWADEKPVERYTGAYDASLNQYLLTYTPTGANILFDLNTNSMVILDYDLLDSAEGSQPMDLLAFSTFTENGLPNTYERVSRSQLVRAGEPQIVSLEDYDIPVISQDNQILLPMQTLMNLLLSVPLGQLLCYNGEGIFFGSSEMLFSDAYNAELGQIERTYTELGDLYYSVPQAKRSRELAEYGVGELCLEMDCFYGLKEAHHIENFYSLLINTGLLGDLLDPDPAKADQAVQTLINSYLDDQHSAYLGNSSMTGKDVNISVPYGYSNLNYANLMDMYNQFQNALMPDGRSAYQEIGDTAYVSFDEFKMKSGLDYYDLDLDSQFAIQDTVSLMMYAHHQITREDSPIKNVVLDLTMNPGGHVDAAIFVIGWFLGEAQLSLVHTFSGAQATNVYRVDANLDRVFDEKDSLYQNYNLYCLCSPLSFSCGNLVPWAYHMSGMVTLIGDTTGGGSCNVQPLATAWGTILQTSGPCRLSFIKNGSYYDIDQGVTPDLHLSKTSHFFDREFLTETIHNLP